MITTLKLSFDNAGLLHGKVAVPTFNMDLFVCFFK